ncbi:MAG: 16S rRNA (uracil(1498)-N(3))-methyltransferase [Thermodesulfobacteriota bacterium]
MNLVLIVADDFVAADQVLVTGRRARHLQEILAVAPGSRVRIGLVDGPLGEGLVVASGQAGVRLAVRFTGPPPPRPRIDLVLGLPRPLQLKRILFTVASLGVDRLFLLRAAGVEKSYLTASILQEDSVKEHLLQGLEQAMHTALPRVSVHPRFRPFVEDLLPDLLPAGGLGLVAHPEAAAGLAEVAPPPLTCPVLLAVGPEGGWNPFELAAFAAAGFLAFSLGPRILRVETAVPVLLGQLQLLAEPALARAVKGRDAPAVPGVDRPEA